MASGNSEADPPCDGDTAVGLVGLVIMQPRSGRCMGGVWPQLKNSITLESVALDAAFLGGLGKEPKNGAKYDTELVAGELKVLYGGEALCSMEDCFKLKVFQTAKGRWYWRASSGEMMFFHANALAPEQLYWHEAWGVVSVAPEHPQLRTTCARGHWEG